MEVIKLENMCHYRDDMIMPTDVFLLQVWQHEHLCLGFSGKLKLSPFPCSKKLTYIYFSFSYVMAWTKMPLAHQQNSYLPRSMHHFPMMLP